MKHLNRETDDSRMKQSEFSVNGALSHRVPAAV